MQKVGVTLLQLRQDAKFAEIKEPGAHGTWSGPVEQAPGRARVAYPAQTFDAIFESTIGASGRRHGNFLFRF